MDEELVQEIIWVMTYFGSDSDERLQPGSKLRSQANRIAEFVQQREHANELLRQHGLDLVKAISRLT